MSLRAKLLTVAACFPLIMFEFWNGPIEVCETVTLFATKMVKRHAHVNCGGRGLIRFEGVRRHTHKGNDKADGRRFAGGRRDQSFEAETLRLHCLELLNTWDGSQSSRQVAANSV